MSYLDSPRAHFNGTFEAGPSTLNNVPSNYKPGQSPLQPVWNPNGNAYIKLIGCTVTSAPTGVPGEQDSTLQGAAVASTDNWGGSGVPSKIVDLDPEQQMVSMFYGLQLKIGDGDNYVIADMTAVWFQNYFFGANATYQSVVTPVEWGNKLTGVVKQWNESSSELLSIRFIAGPVLSQRKAEKPTDSTPFICQIVGTVGPADPADPISFVPARLLRPTPDPNQTRGKFNFGPAKVTTDKTGKPIRLTIDLGSSAPTSSQTLTVSVEPAKAMPVTIGNLEFSPNAQSNNALITDFDLTHLTSAEAHSLLNGPLVLRDASGQQLFAEAASGIYADAYPYVFRMEADTCAEVEFWATRFGAPAEVSIVISNETATTLPLGAAEPPRVGVVGPHGAKPSFDTSVRTKNGRARLTIAGGNPDGFRQYIDGQVYALGFRTDPPTPDHDPKAFLSLLVHDRFEAEPTWENIEPIMKQYAVLYPVMKNMGIDLGDEQSLRANKAALLRVFALPVDNPGYMPVVRDLSDAKHDAIVAWLNAQPDPGGDGMLSLNPD